MPRSDSFGTRRMGRWRRRLDAVVWQSAADDPYHNLKIANAHIPHWFEHETNARDVVARMMCENGEDYLFDFSVTYCTWPEREQSIVDGDKCRQDPEFFVEYFKEHMMNTEAYKVVAVSAKAYKPKYFAWHCINPTCLYIHFSSTPDYPTIMKCRSCGLHSLVSGDRLRSEAPPDAAIMALSVLNFADVLHSSIMNNNIFELALNTKFVKISVSDYRPLLALKADLPQIKVSGRHFIRGRVNREVLVEIGMRPTTRDPATADLTTYIAGTSIELWLMLKRLFSDEKIVLDPSRADRFRQEYISTRWESEFSSFANTLRRTGILLVDSSGVGDTLTALYNLAQKRAGKRTVIKRDGSIVFPTRKVLENIDPFLMRRAFIATEHASYEDASEVFKMEEETHNDDQSTVQLAC